MRIEISAGGLAGACAVREYGSSFDNFLSDTEYVISSFKAVQTQTYQLSGGVGSLQEAMGGLERRVKAEEEKLERASLVRRESHEFLELSVRVDKQVAEQVRRNQEAFYQENPGFALPHLRRRKSAPGWIAHGTGFARQGRPSFRAQNSSWRM